MGKAMGEAIRATAQAASVLVREPTRGLEPLTPVSMRSSSDYFVQSCCGPLTCAFGTIGVPATSFEFRLFRPQYGGQNGGWRGLTAPTTRVCAVTPIQAAPRCPAAMPVRDSAKRV